jgi:hypothetical protein
MWLMLHKIFEDVLSLRFTYRVQVQVIRLRVQGKSYVYVHVQSLKSVFNDNVKGYDSRIKFIVTYYGYTQYYGLKLVLNIRYKFNH